MSADHADTVIASIGRLDPALARWMQMAADGLTADGDEERITEADLQQYLWYDLPRRAPGDTWRPVADAAGVLLALLGLDRYAAIARSATTAAVLDAWDDSPGKGFTAFTAANGASGVEPPDTGLVTWGEIFGTEELRARYAVEAALETAIAEGELRPGGRSWRAIAAGICDRVLLTPTADGGPTRIAAVLEERGDTWVSQGRPADLRAWRATARHHPARDAAGRRSRGALPRGCGDARVRGRLPRHAERARRAPAARRAGG